jgi:hypothetical protein
MSAAGPRRLLLVLPDLEVGGMQTRFSGIARAAAARGLHVSMLAGDGALRAVAERECTVRTVDWSGLRLATLREACDAAAGHDAAVVAFAPQLVHVLPGLAARTALHVCLHNLPGSFEAWFSPEALARLAPLLGALHAAAPASLSAPSERTARRHEADLGLPDGAIGAWPSGVAAPDLLPEPPTGPIATVDVITRLAAEKAPTIAAAAELVRAGRSLGAPVTLRVHGAGPDEDSLRGLLAARLPEGGWELCGPTTDTQATLRDADVVVGVGRSALEAVVANRRVVVSRGHPHAHGHLGPPVTAENLDELAGLTMSWSDRPPHDPLAVWQALRATPAEATRAAGDGVRARRSPERSLDRLLTLIASARDRRGDPARLAGALAEHAAVLGDELAAVRDVGDRLWIELEAQRRRNASTAPTVSP